jgi:hypothetical protein
MLPARDVGLVFILIATTGSYGSACKDPLVISHRTGTGAEYRYCGDYGNFRSKRVFLASQDLAAQ